MSGFSGASGVPKKYVDDLVAQSTANTQLSPSYDSSKIDSVTAYKNGKAVYVSMTIKAGALAAGYNSVSFSISGVSYLAQPNMVFSTQGTADDTKNFFGYVLNNALQIRTSAANAASLLATFVGITS